MDRDSNYNYNGEFNRSSSYSSCNYILVKVITTADVEVLITLEVGVVVIIIIRVVVIIIMRI